MSIFGWWHDPPRRWFTLGSLAVAVALYWVGYWYDDHHYEGFGLRVLASGVGMALTLFLGQVFLDYFADYLAERQWKAVRSWTMMVLCGHLCEITLLAIRTLGLSVDGADKDLIAGGMLPTDQPSASFRRVVVALKEWASGPDKHQNSVSAQSFYDDISWRLDDVRLVLIPRVLQCSRNRELIKELIVWDGVCQSLRSSFRSQHAATDHDLPGRVVAIVDECGDLHWHVSDELSRCSMLGQRKPKKSRRPKSSPQGAAIEPRPPAKEVA